MADFISQLSGQEMDNALMQVNARTPEAWAVGTRAGIPVSQGDETYNNNAKYWALVAKSAVPAGAAAAVLWNQAQALSEANKQTARSNIGAPSGTGTVAGGKNLFNYNDVKVQSAYSVSNRAMLYFDVVGTYTFSHNGSNVQNISYRLWDKSTNAWKSGSSTLGIGRGFTVTMSVNDVLVLWGASEITASSFIGSIPNAQLEEGNTATAYEPFYPSNLQLSRKQNIVNLLNPTLGASTQYGVTATNNGDGTYALSGTNTRGSAVYFTIGSFSFIQGKSYRLTGFQGQGVGGEYSLFVEGLGYPNDIGKGITFVANTSGTFNIVLRIPNGQAVNSILKPMIVDANQFGSATYDDFIEYGHYTQVAEDLKNYQTYFTGTSAASGSRSVIVDLRGTYLLHAEHLSNGVKYFGILCKGVVAPFVSSGFSCSLSDSNLTFNWTNWCNFGFIRLA